MIFSSYKFIFLFLPIVLGMYTVFRKLNLISISKIWLFIASVYFYAQGSRDFVLYFLFTVVFNYIIGIAIVGLDKYKSKFLKHFVLVIGISENLALLGYYKYYNFAVSNINNFSGTSFTLTKIILPIGISFFTFQLIAYIIDCYRGFSKQYGFLDYALFVTFFPQLIVGPIVHHSEIVTQFEENKNKKLSMEMFALGLFVFSIGVGKKIILADPMITYAQDFYNTVAGGFFKSWTAVFAYTFAYYFDFSGYGDMAIGLGLLFNIRLPINFDSPYKARNFSEFWKKWNMTLSQFLNDYVFKSIYKFGDRSGKLFLAVLVTFVVSGIWHGAGWHFILWGIMNGIFVCISYMMILNYKELPFLIAWAITFFGVLITRVMFDSSSISQAIHVYKQMFGMKMIFDDFPAFLNGAALFIQSEWLILSIICVAAIITFAFRNTSEMMKDFKPSVINALYAALIFTIALLKMNEVSNFLYFQF